MDTEALAAREGDPKDEEEREMKKRCSRDSLTSSTAHVHSSSSSSCAPTPPALFPLLRTDGEGHLVGNFPNYYNFHPVEQRTSMFAECYWRELWDAVGKPDSLILLDVGCNEGDLSFAMYCLARTALSGENCVVKLLGVDIDGMLVERATKKFSKEGDVTFMAMDYMNSEISDGILKQYLAGHGAISFDFVSLFSITMWIHINFVSIAHCLDLLS